MLRYAKGKPPRSLAAWQATPNAAWSSVGGADKQDLRDALVRDQGALCAYCQRRIAPDDKHMKIEHWDARSSGGAQLQWTNLLGVCLGNSALEGAPGDVERHCDDARGDEPLYLHPVEGRGPSARDFFRYTASGEVRAAHNKPPVQGDIEVLNLNAKRLKRARQAIFDQLKARLDQKSFTAHELNAEMEKHSLVQGSRTPEHAEFVLYFLSRWLQRR